MKRGKKPLAVGVRAFDGDADVHAGYAVNGVGSEDNLYNDGLAGEGDNVNPSNEYVFRGTGSDIIDLSGYSGGFPGSPPAGAGVVVSGFDGDDTLTATAGNDYLEGGNGTDTLFCGAGTDIFVTGEVFPAGSGCR